jgi:hypothetical protein
MDSVVSFIEKLVSPIDNNQYLRGFLIVMLVTYSSLIVPQAMPQTIMGYISQYKALSFVLTFLLAYLLTRNVASSLVVSVVIFVINYLIMRERFTNQDKLNLLINDYNYQIDRQINKNAYPKKQMGFARPHQVENHPNENPSMQSVDNISSRERKGVRTPEFKKSSKMTSPTQFKFDDDSLRYLNYENAQLNKYQEEVYGDRFTGNSVHPHMDAQ